MIGIGFYSEQDIKQVISTNQHQGGSGQNDPDCSVFTKWRPRTIVYGHYNLVPIKLGYRQINLQNHKNKQGSTHVNHKSQMKEKKKHTQKFSNLISATTKINTEREECLTLLGWN